MKDDNKTKKKLIHELTELRSQNTALEKSKTGIILVELAAEEARRYAESVVETVRDPLLVLDADLKIISANRNFYRTFKATPGETIGSYIYDLGNKQWDIPRLRELLEEVLPEKEAFDDFEVDHNFQDIGHKIMLLNARQIYRKDIGAKMILLAIEDITERRKLEEAHNNLAAIVESADDAIIGKDLEGIIVSWNRGAEIAYGYNAKEVIGKSISLLMPPSHSDEYKELLTKKSSGELIKNYETQRVRKDGKIVDVSLTISPVKDTAGEITGDSIIARDITERKRLESLLIDSEEQYRRLFETAKDGIVLLEKREGKITHANPATEKMLGYTEKDSIGNKLQDIGVLLDTSDFQTTMQDLNKSGILNYRNVKVETKSGQHIDTEIYLVDRARLVQCNIRDITERKLAKEHILRQSKLLAAINSVFYETLTADSEEDVAKTCLKVAQELTGSKFGFLGEITPEGLFTTTALSDPGWEACRIPETQAIVLIKDMVIRGIWGQVILKEQSLIVNDPVSYPDRVGIPEGHPPLTSFMGVPLKDQGKVIGMIAMANRVSSYTADHQQDMEALSVAFVEAIRRKKAEEEIKKINAELEQRILERTTQLNRVNKELEAFSYSVSHDLRAPLRSIEGFSQALLEEYGNNLDDTGKTYLERVRKATQRMGFLIDDLLKLSRVTRSDFHHEAVDLSEMVRVIAEAHQQSHPDRAVAVVIQKGIMVQGDPSLMKVAMENLLGNAWKFTSNVWHPRIEFGTTVRDGKTVCFIRDNGAGFDMAYVDKLFGAFQRLHTSDQFPGTGIGLATVQRVIHRHEGQVWAEGEVGKGATFYFTLPS